MSSRSPFHSLIDNKLTRGFLKKSGAQNPMVRPFVAGDQLSDALQITRTLREEGFDICLDYLGPDALNAQEIKPQVEQYNEAIKAISTFAPGTTLCIRLSCLGMMRSIDDVASSLPDVLTYASAREVEVIIAAETFDYTEDSFGLIRNLSTLYTNLGVVIQSNQRRAESDLKIFINDGNPIRLVKGYGQIKPIDGYTRQEDIDRQFRKQLFELIDSGHESDKVYSICTHDSAMVDAAKLYLKKQGYDPKELNFTFLYGVKTDIQHQTLQLGHKVTISVPYGENWYPYFSNEIGNKSS